MKQVSLLVFSILILYGCQPAARMALKDASSGSPTVLSYSSYPDLKNRIDALLPDSLFPPASIGIKIVSLTTNETLYSLNPSTLFVPASNQKLLTAAAALSILGSDFRLNTAFFVDTTEQRIYVKGFGDPMLSTSDIDSIALRLSTTLPGNKSWTLVGDVSYFDDLYWGSGWMWDDEPDPTAMFITPLCLNNNAIKVQVKPGGKAGDRVISTLDPPTGFASMQISGTTISDSVLEKINVSRDWRVRSNVFTVKGQMRTGDTTISQTVSVREPERYMLTLLGEKLIARGFNVRQVALDTVRSGAVELFRYSHRLDSVVTFAMKHSDNLAEENLLKIMGAEKRNVPGTAKRGISVVKEFLSREGIDTTRIVLADGSGVSRYNLLSPEIVVQLLARMRNRGAVSEQFFNSLPVAGVDGNLSNRMKGSSAQGNLRAKTGTLSGVSALSGYVRTAEGELLAFSIMMQNFPTTAQRYRAVQDGIGILLSNIKRSDF